MSDQSINTILMNDLVGRARQGDIQARDELIRKSLRRLERLAQRMLRKFPNLAPHVEWEEVLSEGTMKLLRALEKHAPANTREYFNLAAAIMRRHLIDLARHFKHILKEVHSSESADSSHPDLLAQQAAPENGEDFDRWSAFHEAVESLSVEEREMFSLIVYHDWLHQDIADLFGCSTKKVQRCYKKAILELREKLGVQMEEMLGAAPSDGDE